MADNNKDLEAYLARIRKTISDSKDLVAQAELRIAETDRMLERQGLSREQVMQMQFSEAQIEAVNAELKRRGMDPLEKWTNADERNLNDERLDDEIRSFNMQSSSSSSSDSELAERQRKFGMMMKPFQI